MFSDRLDKLMTKLDVTNTELAQIAGIDRTNLSRFRNGKRLPKRKSAITTAIVAAIYDHASQNGSLHTLCKVIRADSGKDKKTICDHLKNWLYSDTPDEFLMRKGRSSRSFLSFSDRFDRSMVLAGITNSKLGNLVHVDSSLISHYRTGIRTPQSNPLLASMISDLLYEQISNTGKLAQLSLLMQTKPDRISKESFHDWLCAFSEDADSGNAAMKLLEAFDSYQVTTEMPMPKLNDAVPGQVLDDHRTVYAGTEGLREAVIRFLSQVAMSDAKEMYLYSDQDMMWLVSDHDFAMKWAALMAACIGRKISLKIIHNIDRDPDEMSQAIASWMPLYMSGMIKSYYHTRKVGDRFDHTIFLCPQVGCVIGCNARDSAHEKRYYYFTAPEDLAYYRMEYETLMKHTRPLVRMDLHKIIRGSGNTLKVLDNSGRETLVSASPYKNMGVVINSDSVQIIRVKKPYLSFTVSHPLMHKAFLAYADRLRK